MNVDVAKAFDAAVSDSGRVDSASNAGSEFPGVLESTLGRAQSEEAPADKGADTPAEAESRSAQTGRRSDSGSASNRDGSSHGMEDAEAASEAAAESGAAGAAAAGLAGRARTSMNAESEAEAAGRLTEIDADAGADGRGVEAGDAQPDEGGALEGELAQEVVGRLEADGQLPGGSGQVTETIDSATNDGTPKLAAESATGIAEENRELDSEAAGDRDEDRGARDEARAGAEEAFVDRAAEGGQSGAVDPGLRQAIANSEAAQRAPETVAVDGAAAMASPVAGAMTETTTTGTPGAPMPAAASDAIAVQTEWLATRGGGTARLVLHPPELGEMAIRVTLRGGAVDVVMVAHEARAHGVAEEQAERLAQAFSNRDLRLENFEVRRGGAEDLAMGDGGRFAESGADRDGQTEQEGGRPAGGLAVGQAGGGESAPIPMPRIVSIAPETGVDLRI